MAAINDLSGAPAASTILNSPTELADNYEHLFAVIQDSLSSLQHFDKSAKKVIETFKNRLTKRPADAEQTIRYVANRFGGDSALWTLKKVNEAFFKVITWTSERRNPYFGGPGIYNTASESVTDFHTDCHFHPLIHQKILNLFTPYGPKITDQAFDALNYYKPEEEGRPIPEFTSKEEAVGFHLREHLFYPVKLYGDHFGEEAARKFVSVWASRLRSDCPALVTTYFDKFGSEGREWARKKMEPQSCILL